MASGTVAPSPKYTGFDDNGDPLIGGKLYVFAAGTSTPVTTYTDVALTVANTNPIILDAGGRATIFLDTGSYKFIQNDLNDVLIWSQDNVSAVASGTPGGGSDVDVLGTAGEGLAAGNVVYLDTGAIGTAGRWYKTDADNVATSSTAILVGMVPTAISSGSIGVIRLQGRVSVTGPLTTGAPYYASATAGALTAIAPANVRFIGQADSTITIVIAPNPASGGGGAGTIAQSDVIGLLAALALLRPLATRVNGTTSSATPTPDCDTTDLYSLTAQAAAAAFVNPTGTPANGQKLLIRIKDNGTARALTWGTAYVAGGVALPTTTVLSKILTLGFIYNTDNSLGKWQLVASAQEA